MIEEIAADLYRIEIPLPESPLKSVNSYIIKSSKRNLIIDTGMNRKECMDAMEKGLKELGVDLRETDFFITHFHIDHFGLVTSLVTDQSIIYFNKPESRRVEEIKSRAFQNSMIDLARLAGFPENEIDEVVNVRPGYEFGLKGPLPFSILEDGDTLNIGNYLFKSVWTPGHSKGHLCLYEEQKKILVAGDHILNDITPGIQFRLGDENPLQEYLSSLNKVNNLDIQLVLPGHRSIFKDCKKRIKELEDHHQKRANEIIDILGEGGKDGYQVASQMTWDILYDSWDFFPVLQRFFATGEALAHLKYLEEKGRVRKKIEKQRAVYSLS
jgi:glyoxylase-like metal-dependent hydrolase (beta-lactamase superfamily II)